MRDVTQNRERLGWALVSAASTASLALQGAPLLARPGGAWTDAFRLLAALGALQAMHPFFRLRTPERMLPFLLSGVFVASAAGTATIFASAPERCLAPVLLGAAVSVLLALSCPRPLSHLRARLALFAASVFTSLALAEVAVSLYYSHLVENPLGVLTEYDRDLGWRRAANLGSYNALGLRASTNPDRIPPGAFLVAVQGDSQAEGIHVAADDTFGRQLERCLAEEMRRPVVVLNLGVQGYDLHHYLTQIRSNVLLAYPPVERTVMLLNYNDVGASLLASTYGLQRPYWELRHGSLQLVRESTPFPMQVYGIRYQPRFREYDERIAPSELNWFVHDPRGLLAWSWTFLSVRRSLSRRSPRQFTETQRDTYGFFNPYDGLWLFSEPIARPYVDYEETLRAIFRAWKSAVTGPLVVYLPSRMQFEVASDPGIRHSHERVLRVLHRGPAEYGAAAKWVRKLVSSEGIAFHDLSDDLAMEPRPLDHFLEGDAHFNARGHRFNASRVCDLLVGPRAGRG